MLDVAEFGIAQQAAADGRLGDQRGIQIDEGFVAFTGFGAIGCALVAGIDECPVDLADRQMQVPDGAAREQRLPVDDVPGLRYLHCSLCNTQWNLTRVKCSVCDGPENAVSYRHIDGSEELVQAEVCETCKCYLKIVRRDRNATVDAVADDQATLALDILVDASGYSRSGPNLLLVPGEV